jgi:hypothetical protein
MSVTAFDSTTTVGVEEHRLRLQISSPLPYGAVVPVSFGKRDFIHGGGAHGNSSFLYFRGPRSSLFARQFYEPRRHQYGAIPRTVCFRADLYSLGRPRRYFGTGKRRITESAGRFREPYRTLQLESVSQNLMQRPRKIKNWREAAFYLYKKLFGPRCVRCSEPVRSPKEGIIYHYEKDDFWMIVHSKPCKPKR